MRSALALLLFAGVGHADRQYSVLLAGHAAGNLLVKTNGSERNCIYEFNDRGRGPHIESHYVISRDGLITSSENKGHDYFKGPVDEKFSTSSARVRWKSAAESGDAASGGFFLSMYGPPEELGLLVAALRNHPTLPLLPAGEARMEPLPPVQVGARKVSGYLLYGLSFSPSPVWVDADGELFAIGEEWSMVIRKGEEAAAPALIAAQDASLKARALKTAKTLAHRPAGALVIQNVRLFDARKASVVENQTVIVRGARIEAVGAQLKLPPAAEVIDGHGKLLIPGLWDMHAHVGDDDGPLDLAAGVTTVRDLANDIDKLARLRKSWDAVEAVGPRVIAAGFVDGRGPFAGPTKVFADTPEEARAVVEKYAKLNYVQIKIYSSVKPQLVPIIAKEAHARGLRVSGHIPAFMTAAQAVRDGYDEIQHANMLILNFLPDVKDTRGPERFTAVADRAATLDFSSKEMSEFIALLKEHHTVLDPTLAVFEGMFTDRLGQISVGIAAAADRLPAQVRRGFLSGGLPVPAGKDARYRDSFHALEKLVAQLHAAGLRIVAGTDGLAGFTLQRELELYVEAGLPAPVVLQLASFGAAQIMKREDLGVIEAGKLADMVLIDGDPTVHISDVRKPVVVIKDGVVYKPAELNRELGIKP